MHVRYYTIFTMIFIDGDTFETRAYDFMKGGAAGGPREAASKTMKNGFVMYPTPSAGNRPNEDDL